MKKHSKLYQWFWVRPLFRRLRPRIMTMMLALVLPLSIIAVAMSVYSAYQGSVLNNQTAMAGFSSFVDQLALRNELGNVDLTGDFPATLARKLSPLSMISVGENRFIPHGGNIYVSRDGHETFRVLEDGTFAQETEDFDALCHSRFCYLWDKTGQPFRVLISFPYDFGLRNLPFRFWIGTLIAVLTIVACPFLYGRLKRDILDPMDTFREAMTAFQADQTYRIPAQTNAVSDDFQEMFRHFNTMAAEVQQGYEKDIRLLETEMDNLRLQVNPHMLMNSYNMIYALAESKNYSVIQDYTLCLVDYFRYVLRKGQQQVTVRQELEFVDNFIRIQQIRFPGRFSYVYQADENCLGAEIPPLLIENFVENAIKYALNPREAIEIVVSVCRETDDAGQEKIHIAIADTGSGIRPEILEKLQKREPYVDESGQKHIGIYNCLRRVELFYGDQGEIHFASAPGGGTQVYLIIPYRSPEKEHPKEEKT